MFAPLFALPNGLKGADNEVVHVRPPCQRVAPDRRGFPRVWATYLVKGSIKGSIKGGVKSIKGSHQSIKSHRSIKGGVKSINQITSITSNHIHHTKSITFIHQTHQTTSITSNPSHSSIKPHPSHPSTQSHPITPNHIHSHPHPSIDPSTRTRHVCMICSNVRLPTLVWPCLSCFVLTVISFIIRTLSSNSTTF